MSSSPQVPPSPSVVQQYLSPPRVGTYVAANGGNLAAAVRLYRWNASVAAAFWEVLGHGEVVLRNVIHNELATHHQLRGDPGEWFDDPRGLLTQQALDDVRTPISPVITRRRPPVASSKPPRGRASRRPG